MKRPTRQVLKQGFKEPLCRSGAWLVGVLLCMAGRGDVHSGELGSREAAAPLAVRGVWLTRWDYQSAEDIRRALRWCAAFGLNRVFFQVRGRADAFYRSSLEPWGEEFGARDPGFDPLQVALEQARAAGVELHAWINVLPGWKGERPPRHPHHVFHDHPEWFLVDRLGNRHLTNTADYTILNPCLSEVRSYLVAVLEDILRRYAVDGVHLDYVRFLGRDVSKGLDFPYDAATLALFREHYGGSPFEFPEAWDAWRRSAVNTLLFRMSEAARKVRPGVTVSVAAIQDYKRAREKLFQDVATWQARGWVDEVYPMCYERGAAAFAASARQALQRAAGGAKVFPGIGAHLLRSGEELSRQIEIARSLGAGGCSLFAFASFFPSPSHESRRDPESCRLRSELRQTLLTLLSQDATVGHEPAAGAASGSCSSVSSVTSAPSTP